MKKFGFYDEKRVDGECKHLGACFSVAADVVEPKDAESIVSEAIDLYKSTTGQASLPSPNLDEKKFLRLELFKAAGKMAMGKSLGWQSVEEVVGKQMEALEVVAEAKGVRVSIPLDLL